MKPIKILAALLCGATLLSGCAGAGTALKFPDSKDKTTLKAAVTPSEYNTEIAGYTSAEKRLAEMTAIAENGGITLYFDDKSCDIAIKSADSLYFSTPWNIAGDAKSTDAIKQTIASQVRVTYMDSLQNISELSSFKECVAKGQYTTQAMKDGIQVNMTIGRAEQRILLPPALPAGSFEDVADTLSGRALSRLKAFYKLYDADTSAAGQIDLIRQKYPVIDEMPIYVLKETTEKEKTELEGYFKSAGYTFDAMDKDLKAVGTKETESVNPYFKLSVRYSLENGELVVTIPNETIEYDEKQFTLLEIGLLEYMAAADCKEDGELLIPDGSGAVIGFNNENKKSGNEIKMPVYGYDRSLSYTAGYDNLMTAALPVFGIRAESGTLFGIIEQGEALANIIASAGGSVSGYARAGAVFTYCGFDGFEYKDVNTQYAWNLADKNAYKGDYTLRFILLKPGDSYNEMAACYRGKLNLKKNKADSSLPLTVGLYGSIKSERNILFMPVKRQTALTDFKDAANIATQLKEKGIENLSLRYLGWSAGGLEERPASSAKVLSVLGGKSGLTKLSEELKKQKVDLSLDGDFAYVSNNAWFDGFSASGDTARMLDKTYAGYNQTELSSGLMDPDEFRYALRPAVALAFFEKFNKGYQKLGLSTVSLGTLGGNLNGDKDVKRGMSRGESLLYTKEILKQAAAKYKVVTYGANRYTYEYVDTLLGIPSCASGYPDADYSVPFVQMVLHGSRSYLTPAANLSGDVNLEVLRAAENGSGLYFELCYQNAEVLKLSSKADFYSVDYTTWKEKLISLYGELNDAIGDVTGGRKRFGTLF